MSGNCHSHITNDLDMLCLSFPFRQISVQTVYLHQAIQGDGRNLLKKRSMRDFGLVFREKGLHSPDVFV